MTSLFQDCIPAKLKKALQNAMFGSGDFFPGPGRIMQEYRALSDSSDGTEQHKEWFDHADGENSSLVITTTCRNERGALETKRTTYSDMTLKACWEARKKAFERGLWMVIQEALPGRLTYSYIKWKEGQLSPIYREGGWSKFGDERLPYLVLV